jgi:hypothetical protein
MQMITHDSPRVDAAGKNAAQLQNALFNPRLSMLERLAGVFILTAKPRAAHAAINAVKKQTR